MENFPDYTCLVCGNEMPTVFRKVDAGNIEVGEFVVDRKFFDRSYDSYYLTIKDTSSLENVYRELTEIQSHSEKNRVDMDIESDVSNESFKNMLQEQLHSSIEQRYDERNRRFDNLVSCFGYFLDSKKWLRYAIDSKCKDSVLDVANETIVEKCLNENNEKKLLRFKTVLDTKRFTKAFPFLSDFFYINFSSCEKNAGKLVLEFDHFSEFIR